MTNVLTAGRLALTKTAVCLSLVLATGACQKVLGFEEHELGPVDNGGQVEKSDGGSPGEDAGGAGAGRDTESGGNAGSAGSGESGDSGNSSNGGGTAGSVGSAGSSESGGSAGRGGNEGSAGRGGSAGTSGRGGSAGTSGSGGSAGSTGRGGSAARGGDAGSAGSTGLGGGSTGTAGSSDLAGSATSGGTGGDTGTGGTPEAGGDGGNPATGGSGGEGASLPQAGQSGGCESCAIRDALVHRYSFEGTGTEVTDSVGSANGTIIGTTLSGEGSVPLSGEGQYVELPDGIISALTNATFEAWVTWNGGGAWQRIFDFGSSNGEIGVTYLFLTPKAEATRAFPRTIYTVAGSNHETRLSSMSPFPRDVLVHVGLVFDAANETFTLFMNGELLESGNITGSLSTLDDVNNWLGHSQFLADPDFSGAFHEFRIYDAALSSAQLALSCELGADASL